MKLWLDDSSRECKPASSYEYFLRKLNKMILNRGNLCQGSVLSYNPGTCKGVVRIKAHGKASDLPFNARDHTELVLVNDQLTFGTGGGKAFGPSRSIKPEDQDRFLPLPDRHAMVVVQRSPDHKMIVHWAYLFEGHDAIKAAQRTGTAVHQESRRGGNGTPETTPALVAALAQARARPPGIATIGYILENGGTPATHPQTSQAVSETVRTDRNGHGHGGGTGEGESRNSRRPHHKKDDSTAPPTPATQALPAPAPTQQRGLTLKEKRKLGMKPPAISRYALRQRQMVPA